MSFINPIISRTVIIPINAVNVIINICTMILVVIKMSPHGEYLRTLDDCAAV